MSRVTNPSFQHWKDAGMIYNRYSPVRKHRELMKAAESENLDMEGVRSILKELITRTIPIDDHELRTIEKIEAMEKAQQEC